MKNKYLLLLIISINICSSKNELDSIDIESKLFSFSPVLNTLNELTSEFNKKNNQFINDKYLEYSLYKSLILNSLILKGKTFTITKEAFCKKNNYDMEKLLKWKIVTMFSVEQLKKYDIDCDDEIKKSESFMEDYLLNVYFPDARYEYYLYLQRSKSKEYLLLHNLLTHSTHNMPNVVISELLIENHKKLILEFNSTAITGLWNASTSAAAQGSKIGFENMKTILIDYPRHINFLNKIINL